MSQDPLKQQIKEMMVEHLMLRMEPAEIGDDTVLFSPEGLGLDSIDALELAVGVEKKFGVATPTADAAREAFVSVNTLTEYILKNRSKQHQEEA